MLKKLTLLIFVVSAFLLGAGITFCFANTINPNCPDEIKQAIQNWDKGLDERDAQNQNVGQGYVGQGFSPAKRSDPKGLSYKNAETNANLKVCPTNYELRTLFLASLITLTFNTPVHSQILVSNFIQKLFTIAKHYIRVQSSEFGVQSLVAIFVTLKKYFEKIFLILLGLILPSTCLFAIFYLPLTTYHLPLFYQFHNLRL